MNLLLCSWANIFEPEIAYTFKEMGFQVDSFDLKFDNPFADNNYIQQLSTRLLSKQYDFIFTANYLPIVSITCNIHKVKYISWVADSPCPALNSNTLENPCNYIFIFDKALYEEYKLKSKGNLYYLPLGSNPSRLDQINVTDDEFQKYKCDLSFVGSLYTTRTNYNSIQLSEYWHGYFEGMIEAQLAIPGNNILNEIISDEAVTVYEQSLIQSNPILLHKDNPYQFDVRNFILDNYIGKECSHRERIRTLDALSSSFSLHLYTGDEITSIPKAQYKGMIDPYIDVFKVYKSSKINLNITSRTIKTGLPLRIFDILGAGGFLITNNQSELSDFFEDGKDLVTYTNIEDLKYKISYYLANEEERNQIAKNGYNKVKNNFLFSSQIMKMFELITNSSIT
jgi:spore maturation protein CgeB